MNAYNKHMFPHNSIPWEQLPEYRQVAWNTIQEILRKVGT